MEYQQVILLVVDIVLDITLVIDIVLLFEKGEGLVLPPTFE